MNPLMKRRVRKIPRQRFRPATEGLEQRLALAVDGNDTMSTAINLGTLSGTITRTGDVGSPGDNMDFYRFLLGGNGADGVRVRLSGLSDDLDLELLDSGGRSIQIARNGGRADDVTDRTLAPGTYFIRVFKGRSNAFSRYSLRFEKLNSSDPEFNNSRDTAVNLGGFSGTRVRNGTLGLPSSDTQDFYRFTANAGRTLRYTLDGLESDLDIEILNDRGGVISFSRASGRTTDSGVIRLTGGSYFVRVYRPPNNSSPSIYRLSLSLT